MDSKILDRCMLFSGKRGEELERALSFFRAQEKKFPRGHVLHWPGEKLDRFGLLLEGNVRVYMDDFDGNRLLMANVTPGLTFGEALCFLERESQIRIEAVEDSTVLSLDPSPLKCGGPDDPEVRELSCRFASMLAARMLSLNDRIQILSKQSIRDKVITLLSQRMGGEGKGEIRLPFNREAMATYLGVNQSALSRELGRMRDEGIISFSGNRFTVL